MKAQREARIVKGLAVRVDRASSRFDPEELHAGAPDYNKKEWREVVNSLSDEDVFDITERVGDSFEAFQKVTDFMQEKM